MFQGPPEMCKLPTVHQEWWKQVNLVPFKSRPGLVPSVDVEGGISPAVSLKMVFLMIILQRIAEWSSRETLLLTPAAKRSPAATIVSPERSQQPVARAANLSSAAPNSTVDITTAVLLKGKIKLLSSVR